MPRAVKARDLKEGDVLVFERDVKRTIRKVKPSSIDPVLLIYFEGTDETIAKSPVDVVVIDD